MNDYSDLTFLIGAMVIYSLLVVNTNRAFVQNSMTLTNSEIEYNAVALGKSVLDKVRWKMNYGDVTKNKVEELATKDDSLNFNDIFNVKATVTSKTMGGEPNKEVKLSIYSDSLATPVSMSYIKTNY